MDESVNTGVEETTLSTSQVENEKTTDESVLETDVSSENDVKTPEVDNKDETVAGALNQVKSEKGVNRVQELANRAKESEERAMRLEEANRQLMSQLGGGYAPTQMPDTAVNYSNLQIQALAENQRQLTERLAFEKAETQFPELNPESPQYNRDFDDAVYAMYKSQNMSPSQAASRIKNLMKLGESAASARIAQAEATKSVNNAGSQRRASDDNYGNDEVATLRKTLRETGGVDALTELLKRM